MTIANQTPSTALAVVDPANVPIALSVFGEERLAVLKEQLGRGWKQPMTDAELEHIALVCQRTRLDPLARPPQIYFIQRYDKSLNKYVMTPQTSIDGARLIAARTREYLGQVGPEWTADGETWRTVWLSNDPPAAARVGVIRKGFSTPIWSTAVWSRAAQWVDEYDRSGNRTGSKKLAPFWEKMGAEMLAKSAEFNALKRTFPEETNELELQALEAERRSPERIAHSARRYEEIFGADEEHTFHDLPEPRVGLDVETGEIVDPDAEIPDADQEAFVQSATSAGYVCAECGSAVLDQFKRPVNDNQADLIKQRYGSLLCKDCAKKAPASPATQESAF